MWPSPQKAFLCIHGRTDAQRLHTIANLQHHRRQLKCKSYGLPLTQTCCLRPSNNKHSNSVYEWVTASDHNPGGNYSCVCTYATDEYSKIEIRKTMRHNIQVWVHHMNERAGYCGTMVPAKCCLTSTCTVYMAEMAMKAYLVSYLSDAIFQMTSNELTERKCQLPEV